MSRIHTWMAAVAIAAAASAAAFYAGNAWAGGVPASAALTYSGLLEDAAGAPLTGDHPIQINLWSAAMPSGGATPLCQTQSTPYTLAAGRFAVQLPDTCSEAIRSNTEVWAEVVVDGVSLGTSKLGAVPYALEAAHATAADSAAGALAGQVVPAGMIAMYAGACPSGWAEYAPMAGRFPRGEHGGSALDQGGSDDAIVVAHSHALGSLAVQTAGAHAHDIPCNYNNSSSHHHAGRGSYVAESPNPADGSCTPAPVTASAGDHTHTLTGSSASTGATGVGQNMPRFQEVVFCVKQ